MLRIVLYQPDIPQNLGAILRLTACLRAELHVVLPCGFPLDDKKLKRAGMDYIEKATLVKHADWRAFQVYRASHAGNLLLIETDGNTPYTEHAFADGDYLMLGRESAGTPAELYGEMDASLHIPMAEGVRSLNVGMAAAIVLAEAVRQLG
jgi:tRNA (cytidine/uridine-2'-O-)-methyltransferase